MVILGSILTIISAFAGAYIAHDVGGTPAEIYIATLSAGTLMEVLWIRLNIFRG